MLQLEVLGGPAHPWQAVSATAGAGPHYPACIDLSALHRKSGLLQAVPRLVFGLALLWAWLNIPVPIYGTLWLLALAYFTVMMPLGERARTR